MAKTRAHSERGRIGRTNDGGSSCPFDDELEVECRSDARYWHATWFIDVSQLTRDRRASMRRLRDYSRCGFDEWVD